MLKIFITIVATLLFVGCSSKYEMLKQNPESNVERSVVSKKVNIEYLILPQDRLKIILYKDQTQTNNSGLIGEDINPKGILVDTKGYIVLPLIGMVKVSGMTQTQAAAKITKLYKIYLNTPSVYLEVMNKKVIILGEVNNPGIVPLDREKINLFEAIAYCHDFTNFAQKDAISIISQGADGKLYMRNIDLMHIDKLRYRDLILRPNDIVYVRPNGWKKFKVASDGFTVPFETISKLAAPFITLKYLSN